MRMMLFAKRNIKEIIRDPMSYIFCLGFPVIMLAVFALINHFTGGATPMFELGAIVPGICVFSYSFTMLFMALRVSGDRTSSFLARLFVSPMTASDFVLGYAVPGLLLAICQTLICFAAGYIIGAIIGASMNLVGVLFCTLCCIPAMVLFVAFGILFGCLFNDKAAPGASSIIISGGGMLSGAWMPLEAMGAFGTFCRFLPFYPAVIAARSALALNALEFEPFVVSLLTVCAYAAVISFFAVRAFRRKMQR